MTKAAPWFNVDRDGLRKLLERRGGPGGGKIAILHELVANAWDADGARRVEVLIEHVSRGRTRIVVTDDAPDGFARLDHAWTLFAESTRRDDTKKRGRFNLGEKVALAFCEQATIRTTTGAVAFEGMGRRLLPDRMSTRSGSEFSGIAQINKREAEEIASELRRLIVPLGIEFVVDGVVVPCRAPVVTFEASLVTESTDTDGMMHRRRASATVRLYEPIGDRAGAVHELGIPVVETGDPWDVDVGQKVPLNMERDNVPPAWLRDLRAIVANHAHHLLDQEAAAGQLAADALASPLSTAEAIRQVIRLRHGERVAVFDPSDPEANMRLVSEGYQLIHGGSMTGPQWEGVRRSGAALPAGQISPTPRAAFSPDGPDRWLPADRWTDDIRWVVGHAVRLGRRLLPEVAVRVDVLSDVTVGWDACLLGDDHVVLNLGRLGHGFFSAAAQTRGGQDALHQLLVHELAHQACGNHLDAEYAEACCRLGARLTRLALDEPEMFHLREDATRDA